MHTVSLLCTAAVSGLPLAPTRGGLPLPRLSCYARLLLLLLLLLLLVPIGRSIVLPIIIAELRDAKLLAQPCAHLQLRRAVLLLQLSCKVPAECCLQAPLILGCQFACFLVLCLICH